MELLLLVIRRELLVAFMIEIIMAALKTGSGSFLNLLFGVITSKIFAVNLGPAGVGLFSVLRQTRDTLLMLTSFNGNSAIVQGLASREDSTRNLYTSVVSIIILISTVSVIVLLIIGAPIIASYTLDKSDSQSIWLIRGISIPLILSTGIMLFSSILNGYRAIGRLALVQVAASAISMLIAFPITIYILQENPDGFIWMMSVSTSIGCITAFVFARNANLLPTIRDIRGVITKEIAIENSRYFLSFALTTLVTGFASTLSVLVIRSMTVRNFGLNAAGIFDVAWTLSMMYITLVLTSFGTYYMPTLSQSKELSAKTILITRIFRFTFLLLVPIITSIVVLKPLIVQVLYSPKFFYSLIIIRWMLIGDYLKSTSWVFGVSIIATADKKTLFWSEILFQFLFLILAGIAILQISNLEGIGIAFVVTYFVYLGFTGYYVRKNFQFNLQRSLVFKWFVGFIIIIGASVHTWTDTQVSMFSVILWGSIAVGFSWLSLYSSERNQIYSYIKKQALSLTNKS